MELRSGHGPAHRLRSCLVMENEQLAFQQTQEKRSVNDPGMEIAAAARSANSIRPQNLVPPIGRVPYCGPMVRPCSLAGLEEDRLVSECQLESPAELSREDHAVLLPRASERQINGRHSRGVSSAEQSRAKAIDLRPCYWQKHHSYQIQDRQFS